MTFFGKFGVSSTKSKPRKVTMEFNTNSNHEQEAAQPMCKLSMSRHLLSYLKRVKDGRKRRGVRYPLEIILALFILAKLCGENKVYGIADWVQQRSRI